ncbi:MAG: dihydropteroate synthase [Calditrichaeota bacterium]|nr:MAG: dihydropteroate synthase [Calditrichota bacterium]
MRGLVENVLSHHRWEYTIPGGKLILEDGKPLIMGILNVTPDSFSDGGKFLDAGRAVEHGRKMLEAGADVLDIGGESTRPGAPEVPAEEEWRRIAPVLKELLEIEGCVVSVDTTKSEVAGRALEAGAHIINDISGMTFDPRMREVVARYGVPVILMHIKGTPRTMQKNPHYHLLLEEVTDFLHQRCREAHEQGIDQIIVDPGIGFGKRPEDNLELIRRLGELKALGYPILLGPSRKSFIGHVLDRPVEERLIGTLTSVVYGIMQGAHIVRVHDVEETHQAVKLVRAIREGKALST